MWYMLLILCCTPVRMRSPSTADEHIKDIVVDVVCEVGRGICTDILDAVRNATHILPALARDCPSIDNVKILRCLPETKRNVGKRGTRGKTCQPTTAACPPWKLELEWSLCYFCKYQEEISLHDRLILFVGYICGIYHSHAGFMVIERSKLPLIWP